MMIWMSPTIDSQSVSYSPISDIYNHEVMIIAILLHDVVIDNILAVYMVKLFLISNKCVHDCPLLVYPETAPFVYVNLIFQIFYLIFGLISDV